MADDGIVTELDIKEQPKEKQGFFSELGERFKTLIGIKPKRTEPNVKVKILHSTQRDHCLDQLALGQDQLLVSDMYEVLEEEKKKKEGELIVPLDMPERSIPPEVLYVFTYCMRLGDKWQREPAEYKEGECVHGRLAQMNVFCVIAELKPEYSTIGPEGGSFISEKDKRISIDFPENAVQKKTKFTFTSDCVDQRRFEEYKKVNESFCCIVSFTNLLTVHPSTKLQTEANLSLSLDTIIQDNDCQVMILHWEEGEDEEDVTVLECQPESNDNSVYNIPVKSFSGHSGVAAKRNAHLQDITRAAKFAFGKQHLCVLMTFIDYDENKKVHFLLVDCVEFYKVNAAVDGHRQGGMIEAPHSRSRDIELKDKAKIKISIDGSIKQHDKAIRINSFSFHKMASTNKVDIPFTVTAGQDCNIRFYWGQQDHKVYFSLEQVKTIKRDNERQRKKRPTHATKTDKHKRGSAPLANVTKLVGDSSKHAELQRQGSTYQDLIPVLTDKSLAALASFLPLRDWRSIGIELNFTGDIITTILDNADRINSNPAFELLREWRIRNMSRPQEDLIEELIQAFKELQRNDVVEVILKAKSRPRRISRSDMDVRQSTPTTPTGTVFTSELSSLYSRTDESDNSFDYTDIDPGSVSSSQTMSPLS